MQIQGRVNFPGDGLTISTRGMITPLSIIGIHTDNIANFGVPGYQAKQPIVTSFVETLGAQAIDKVTNTDVGRVRLSGNPLDLALNTKGYFQKLGKSGSVELTRDGRMQLDKEGYLLALDGKKFLSASGTPIRFPWIPKDVAKEVKVTPDGTITAYDGKKGQMVEVGKLGVVAQNGSILADVDVKQGYVEDSNVYLQQEFVGIVPLRRQFEANRQLFILQSDGLSRLIQELGRTQ